MKQDNRIGVVWEALVRYAPNRVEAINGNQIVAVARENKGKLRLGQICLTPNHVTNAVHYLECLGLVGSEIRNVMYPRKYSWGKPKAVLVSDWENLRYPQPLTERIRRYRDEVLEQTGTSVLYGI